MRPDRGFRGLETERLRLRRSVAADAPSISAYRSDPEVHRFQGWERTDVEAVRDEIEEMRARAPGEAGGWVQLTAEDASTGELVGDVGLAIADGEPDVVKIGYTIDPAFQGRGYATEAVRELVRYAFDDLGAGIVRMHASADNAASIRVAEKAGLRFVERRAYREDDEIWFGVRYELPRDARGDRGFALPPSGHLAERGHRSARAPEEGSTMEHEGSRDRDERPVSEDDPALQERDHEGTFATGQEDLPHHPEDAPDGRFARGQSGIDGRPADRLEDPDDDRRSLDR